MVSEKTRELIEEFAKRESKILAITEGNDPEEGAPALYFLVGSNKFD